jgi:glycosyltransferase involved in cell wall biosynthesis
MDDRVGAVVIGRNEGRRLDGCLESLLGKASCIVYVDSGSSDGSPIIAEQLGVHVLRLKHGPFFRCTG